MDKLFLLDAYALIYRAYYAFIKNPRINSKGMNTSAVMGFVNTLNEILTKEQPLLTARIMQELDRGVTLINSTGGYTGDEQKMILCAVNREEIVLLKRMTYELDPDAFFMMLTTDEVLGYGWLAPEKNT